MDKTSLGDRMKGYERAYDYEFTRRIPIIVRCDGKSFGQFTRYYVKPFDESFVEAMRWTMNRTAEKLDGCVFAYTQSDEISFVLRNDQTFETEPWFGNRLQKIVSVVAAMVSVNFIGALSKRESGVVRHSSDDTFKPRPVFDTRAFTVPDLDEAANCLVWRQQDASKNSISSAVHWELLKKYGDKGKVQKMLHGLGQNARQELLFQETGLNWNDYAVKFKRGSASYKTVTYGWTGPSRLWYPHDDIPVFTKDRDWLMDKLTETSFREEYDTSKQKHEEANGR